MICTTQYTAEPMRVHREPAQVHQWFELEPMSIFHTINAWQEGDLIRMYTCYTPQARGPAAILAPGDVACSSPCVGMGWLQYDDDSACLDSMAESVCLMAGRAHCACDCELGCLLRERLTASKDCPLMMACSACADPLAPAAKLSRLQPSAA